MGMGKCRLAAAISFVYFAASVLWIMGSDALLRSMHLELATVEWLQTLKGWFFVTLTSVLLWRTLELWQKHRDLVQLALGESESRLRQMADSIQEVFWLTDPEKHRILFVSSAYQTIWGRSCQELYRRPRAWLEAIVQEDRERVERLLASQALGSYDVVFRIDTPEGEVRWIHDRAFPIRNDDGEIVRIAGVARDITEQQVNESRRQELEQQLRQSQKMEALGQLAGGIAHDFNNLLTIIESAGSLLAPASQEDLECLQAIQHSVEKGAELTRQLLAFSRKQELRPEVVEASRVFDQSARVLRRLVGDDILIVTDWSPDLPKVLADAGMLEQVLVNLVVNSRDAMPAGGRLFLGAREVLLDGSEFLQLPPAASGRFVCLEVQDEGQGIPAAVLPHVFDPFFTTKEVGKGTGLGLSTVYGIVQRHGGALHIVTREAEGTTVRVYFPVSEQLVGPGFMAKDTFQPVP